MSGWASASSLASERPGPSSSTTRTPLSDNSRMQSAQRTGSAIARASAAKPPAASKQRRPSMPRSTGAAGACAGVSAITTAKR